MNEYKNINSKLSCKMSTKALSEIKNKYVPIFIKLYIKFPGLIQTEYLESK